MITIFTPTYNRAHLLPRLYKSICKQDCMDFEWLVIDDGSIDDTAKLFDEWTTKEHPFSLIYKKVQNGGKQRAINLATDIACGEYFFIVDSDDALAPNAVSFIKYAFATLPNGDDSFIGISGRRVCFDGGVLRQKPNIDPSIGYVDCLNIERSKYSLQADMAEVFYTKKLKKYKFPVWKGEIFTPEAVVWDQMALDGYRMRWFDAPIYYCEYQQGGLTHSTWPLLGHNPMGYAMLFNTQLKYKTENYVNLVLQFISCCCLAGEYAYLIQCNSKLVYLLFPIGWLLSLRRRMQIRKLK